MASSWQRTEINGKGEHSLRRARPATSDAIRATQLLQELARHLLLSDHAAADERGDTVTQRANVQGAVRLCVRILTSHIGEPLILGDEASIVQVVRTRLAKVCGLSVVSTCQSHG